MPRKKYGRRGLSAEERELWQKVVEKATPIRAIRPIIDLPVATGKVAALAVRIKVKPFKIGQTAAFEMPKYGLSANIDQPLARFSASMDRRSFKRLKNGKLAVDGRIDLHGMTQDQAHPALVSFVVGSHAQGRRLLLVITGKGKPGRDDGIFPVRRGVLKHLVPQWLALLPLMPLVLQVTQAHAKHGGSGAYYVYLRRRR